MHPHLNNVKAPIEIQSSFSFRCLLGKQLEDGKIAGLGQFELCLGFRKACSCTLACHRQRAALIFHAWSQAFFYGIEQGAPLSISGVPLARIPASAHIPDLRFLFEEKFDAVCLEQCWPNDLQGDILGQHADRSESHG